jgi:hypothetical protein
MIARVPMRSFQLFSGILVLLGIAPLVNGQQTDIAQATDRTLIIETNYLRYEMGSKGENLKFVDKRTGADYCLRLPVSKFASVVKGGQKYEASSVTMEQGRMTIIFGRSAISALIAVSTKEHYITLDVLAINDNDVNELTFADISLMEEAQSGGIFTGCAVAMNLKTRVDELPGLNRQLKATCYRRFGIVGAKVAIIGCPASELRGIIKEVVGEADELPHSTLGGPWAMDNTVNRDSYLFNFGDLTEKTVDAWINLAGQLGVKQINMHGGGSFRFGDLKLNENMYPQGRRSLKAVIDKIHSAGLKAGLHSYSFFVYKKSEWVTPVPEKRLAKNALFILAESIGPNDTTLRVNGDKSGEKTGASVTLQIDDELIIYPVASQDYRNILNNCIRGAYGTRISAHNPGTTVYRLKEHYGCFFPDGDSTLFAEVAARLAELYRECGFDTIYFDALDGAGEIAGAEYGWHYAPKFAFEVCRRLDRPAVMEMSCLTHHLWFVRSRAEAWDHPSRGYKKFIDLHCKANEGFEKKFLPGSLGWWKIETQFDFQTERTFTDDIEYLCGKALGGNYSLSFAGITPADLAGNDYVQKLASIIKQYETLRRNNYFGGRVKEKLRQPGAEVSMEQNSDGQWKLYPASYKKHKVESADGVSDMWKISSVFQDQPIKLRIEALMSAGSYDDPNNPVLADFKDNSDFLKGEVAPGMNMQLMTSSDNVKGGRYNGTILVSNKGADNRCWVEMRKVFSPHKDIRDNLGIGVWVYGDGQGETLNFQLRSPAEGVYALGDHYVVVDFSGWRYFELIEPEGQQLRNYVWPYIRGYLLMPMYRFSINYASIERLSLWCNNIPAGKTIRCHISPVKAIPLVQAKLLNPSITIDGKTLVFPVELPSGYFIEFNSLDDCKVYDSRGFLLKQIRPEGDIPVLKTGTNWIKFDCGVSPQVRPRSYVTVISRSDTAI